jgi:hypothetical protein
MMHNKLIFDEEELVGEILINGFLGNKVNYQELSLLTKYYYWIDGLRGKSLEKEILSFCEKNDKCFDKIDSACLIDLCMKKAEKYNLRAVHPIIITQKEVENIKTAKNFKKQKFLFCMLVYAKALKFSGVRSDPSTGELKDHGYHIRNSFLREIKNISGLKESYDEVLYWLHDYKKLGLIKATKRRKIHLLFGEFQGIPAFVIDTDEGMVDKYIEYCGGELIYCEKCGEEIIKTGKNMKMCKECAIEDNREKTKNRMRDVRKQNV